MGEDVANPVSRQIPLQSYLKKNRDAHPHPSLSSTAMQTVERIMTLSPLCLVFSIVGPKYGPVVFSILALRYSQYKANFGQTHSEAGYDMII